MMKTKKKSAGFTLIEVLIGLTLLTIVLGAIYSTFFMVQRALERFEHVSLKYHEARTTLDIIRREIESAYIIKPQHKDITRNKTLFLLKDRDIFGKSASTVYFTAFPYRDKNLHVLSYSVEESENKLKLLKMDAPAVTISALFSKLYQAELMDGIDGFSIETLFNNKWVKTWDASQINKLPDSIRVSILFDDNGKKVRLTEYAKPRIGKIL
jgi:general secretion pathway protein J